MVVSTWSLREWNFGWSIYRSQFGLGWHVGLFLGVRAFVIGRRA